jgi:hypothetical protein
MKKKLKVFLLGILLFLCCSMAVWFLDEIFTLHTSAIWFLGVVSACIYAAIFWDIKLKS